MLRRDLQACLELAASVAGGAPSADARAGIESLQTNGPLFQLRASCLQYCSVLHRHHSLEDAVLFPAIRRDAAHLGPALDRLEDDHRRVSGLLDEVEAAAGDLVAAVDTPTAGDIPAAGDTRAAGESNDVAARERLAGALTELAGHLTEHLDFEEAALAPALEAWPL
jgi:hypothetical protein